MLKTDEYELTFQSKCIYTKRRKEFLLTIINLFILYYVRNLTSSEKTK